MIKMGNVNGERTNNDDGYSDDNSSDEEVSLGTNNLILNIKALT
jgi:hypothetical protein